MYDQNDQVPAGDAVSKINAEINEWARGIRCIFAVLTLLPLYYCSRVLLAAPKFGTIFEDMLGSQQKLPVLTRLVLMNAMPVLGFMWLLAALAFYLIFTVKRARNVWISAVISAFIFIASGHLVAIVLMEPLITVIQNLSGGGETP